MMILIIELSKIVSGGDPLLYTFNLSCSSEIFPDSLKIGKVTPIYKAGASSDLGNYRPIHVLPCFF